MEDPDLRDRIGRLEAEIEDLSRAAERCRKISLAAKAAIGAGAVVFIGMSLQVIGFDAMGLIGSIAAIIGGVVVAGSNATTWNQTTADMKEAEAERAELIGRMNLRTVAGVAANVVPFRPN